VVFISLRHSALAAPVDTEVPSTTLRQVFSNRAYRAALVSNFATGWSAFGLRVALVPLFVTEVMHRSTAMAGAALAMFALGNVIAVVPSGGLSDRTGRRPLLIAGLALAGIFTGLVGLSSSLPLFMASAFIAGAASGVFSSPQQAAVADIIGNKARGGTAVATFQMMSDLGSIAGSLGVGVMAEHLSYGWAFVLSGAILLMAAIFWCFAPETRVRQPVEHTPPRVLGPEAAGELP
jgi:MFS family permease